MTDRELMQQALSTLEGWANHGEWVWPESALEQAKRNTTESIAALRERLAQPDQAPRQWQGLADEERIEFRRLGLVGVEIVESKLKEKNA